MKPWPWRNSGCPRRSLRDPPARTTGPTCSGEYYHAERQRLQPTTASAHGPTKARPQRPGLPCVASFVDVVNETAELSHEQICAVRYPDARTAGKRSRLPPMFIESALIVLKRLRAGRDPSQIRVLSWSVGLFALLLCAPKRALSRLGLSLFLLRTLTGALGECRSAILSHHHLHSETPVTGATKRPGRGLNERTRRGLGWPRQRPRNGQ